MELIWETPPPAVIKAKASKWKPVIEELKKHPGEWALIGTDLPGTTVNSWLRGAVGFTPIGSFEFVRREIYIKPGKKYQMAGKVYARYIGEKK